MLPPYPLPTKDFARHPCNIRVCALTKTIQTGFILTRSSSFICLWKLHLHLARLHTYASIQPEWNFTPWKKKKCTNEKHTDWAIIGSDNPVQKGVQWINFTKRTYYHLVRGNMCMCPFEMQSFLVFLNYCKLLPAASLTPYLINSGCTNYREQMDHPDSAY